MRPFPHETQRSGGRQAMSSDHEKHNKKKAKAAKNGHLADTQIDLSGLSGFPDFATLVARSAPAPANAPTWEGPVALVGARLIDGTGADPIDDATLIFEGDRIAAVGRGADVPVPPSATVFEAHGMTLMPGMIDCHVHLRGQWGYNILRNLQT